MAAWRYLRNESLAVPLLALLLTVVALVPPRGDYPMNDDWIYAQTVQEILDTGAYDGHPYADPLFLVHAYWGALVTSIFGFSFVALRCSSLLLLWVAGWMAARCAREVGAGREVSLMTGALIIANPIALNLGYTFMTDITFLALAHCSVYAFLRAYRSESALLILLGSTLAALAYMVRQFGLLIPVAFILAEVFRTLKREVSFDWRKFAASIAPWLIVFALIRLLPESARGLSPDFDLRHLGSGYTERLLVITQHILRCLAYASLFLGPLILWRVRRPEMPNASHATGFALLFAVGFWLLTRGQGSRLPYFGNMLYDLGVGPITLRGIVQDGRLANPVRIDELWWVFTAVCGIGAILMLRNTIAVGIREIFVLRTGHAPARRTGGLFLIALASAYILVLIIPGMAVIYDRYLLMCILPIALLLVPKTNPGKRQWILGTSVFVMMLGFSVVTLQDYTAWNHARWNAWRVLESEYGATPESIDGGYEFHGWHTSGIFVTEATTPETREYGPKGGWVINDPYAISFVERENFVIVDTVPYYSWLGFEERDILILRRVREDEF